MDFVDDYKKITQYKQWLDDVASHEEEFAELGVTIKEIDNEIKSLSNKRTSINQKLAKKKMYKEKEKLINRRFELNDLISEANEEPMKDPKRDPKWDKRLMTNWSDVWSKWMNLLDYKNI